MTVILPWSYFREKIGSNKDTFPISGTMLIEAMAKLERAAREALAS